jgi:partner of Y14 and mago
MDANALPKGHIIGWVPPSEDAKPASGTTGMSKSAKKNAKRKEKREEKKQEIIRESWEDEDDKPVSKPKAAPPSNTTQIAAAPVEDTTPSVDLSDQMDKLDIQDKK